MTTRSIRWHARGAAWGIWGTALLAAAASLLLEAVNSRGGHPLGVFVPIALVPPLAVSAVGALAVRHHPRNAVAWLLGVSGTAVLVDVLASQYATYGLLIAPGAPDVAGARLSAWVQSWFGQTSAWLLPLLLLLFPNGRLPSPRWRPAAGLMLAGMVFAFAADALRPGRLESKAFEVLPVHNPFGIAGAGELLDVLNDASRAAYALAALLAVASLVVRYRRCAGKERLQLKWVAFGALVLGVSVVVFIIVSAVGPENSGTRMFATLILLAGTLALAATVGVAMVRYRLYDIDRLISRTVAYALVSAVLGAVYATGILVLGQLFAPLAPDSQLAVAGSTLAAAAAFGPVRRRVQAAVDRRFNRARYDAVRTVEAFRGRLRDKLDLDELSADLVATVGATVQPVRASVWLRSEETG